MNMLAANRAFPMSHLPPGLLKASAQLAYYRLHVTFGQQVIL
jgi:hypothetical protein